MLVTTLFATAASASPQITHIFEPNTSQSFNISGSVSQNLNLTDSNGKAVTLNTSGQLVPAGLNIANLAVGDLNALIASTLKVDYDDKTKTSFVAIMSTKSKVADQEIVRFYMPSKISIDGNMMIQGMSAPLVSTAAQSQQGVGVTFAIAPGSPNHVDNTDPAVACTYTVSVPDGQDCTWVQGNNRAPICERFPAGDNRPDPRGGGAPPQAGGGRPDPGPGGGGRPDPGQGGGRPDPGPGGGGGQPAGHQVCTTHYDINTYNGTQSCRTYGDTWTDTYTLTVGSSAQYSFGQDYNTITTECTPCQ
jgi:hypothetical protein